ncbi:outer membrane beta-barrel protein [Sphingobacterium oryzagri]|uniref:Outer membrane beta-barrel protein n=1 Tax=Sphingobacterium oryzagri TaxID=3025669 RepID=A0ABY7WLJ9_9SPHI|nr:outer membrane beta-barrel protein [Sphingobacterium sp. KACC 22765]WDF69311.1 outer membrane beta-barrel protein [Sphingobacterium sp. KACC 22765]
MKRSLFILLFLILQQAYAQQQIKGTIVNGADLAALENASIVLLDSDSIMRYFTRADQQGKFQWNTIKSGNYIAIVSYPKFEIYSQSITVADKPLQLDSIKINSQSNLLEEVVVNQRIPIKIKGDTIEYDAGSFETEKNAKLEDLLRRLPGLTVSATGEITAQGKSVSKVFIDGEEFFGYDPKIAIRNVRADAVDKVQVYERKSEEAELTGIDDGVRLQTVNVVLKEEARKGIFGNADANIGTHNLFDANLFAAKFNKTERIGLTGNWNNMGNTGDASRIRMNNQIIGDPMYKNAGINYDNNFLQRKLQLNSSYNFNNRSLDNESESFRTQTLNNGITQETTQESRTRSDNKNNNLRAQVRYRIDSLSNLNIQLNGGIGSSASENISRSSTTRNAAFLANDFDRNNSGERNNENIDLRVDFRRRLNKNGRSINLHMNTHVDNSRATDLVDELTNYYDSLGMLNRSVLVDQTRLTDNKSNRLSGAINFSEPLSKQMNLTVGYSINSSSRTALINAYNNTDNGTVSVLDSLYSQNQLDAAINNGFDVNLSYNTEKVNINVSTKATYRYQELTDTYRDINLDRNFWQNNINANINYRISNSRNLTLGYQNNANVPSFAQLQPLQPPTNDLFRQLGNPDLKRETNNALNLNFNKFSLMNASSFNINASTNFTNNAIVNRSIIDSSGRTTTSFVNIQDFVNWNARINSNYTKPIFNGLVQFGPFAALNFDNNYQYINGELNRANNTNGNLGINANKQSSKGVDFNFNLSLGLNNEANSIQRELDNTAFRSSSNADLKYFLPYKFSLTQVIFYSYTGKTKVFPEPIQQFYMNLELTRKLLKSESLLLSLKAFDVFNSFNNINRSSSNGSFSETQQELLSQYLMVGLKWDFNKNLGKKND